MPLETHYKVQTISQDEFIDLKLFQAGLEHCRPAHHYGPAIRKHYLFHYVLSGKGTLQSTDSEGEDHVYQLHSGQGFLISPKQVNTYLADSEDPWSYIWIELDGLFVKRALALAGLSFDAPVYTTKDNHAKNKVATALLSLVNHLDQSSFSLIGNLFLVLDTLIEASQDKNTVNIHDRKEFYIEEAKTYILNNYQRNISIEDIADYCGLNRNYLNRIFKSSTSTSLQKFLLDVRLNAACNLLKFTENSIQDISLNCGYSNQLYFSKAFKQKFGESPTVWRRMNRLRKRMNV